VHHQVPTQQKQFSAVAATFRTLQKCASESLLVLLLLLRTKTFSNALMESVP
jgi:hypothetical protein